MTMSEQLRFLSDQVEALEQRWEAQRKTIKLLQVANTDLRRSLLNFDHDLRLKTVGLAAAQQVMGDQQKQIEALTSKNRDLTVADLNQLRRRSVWIPGFTHQRSSDLRPGG